MDVFGILPALKRENRQYWGRELGMCWQMLVTNLCQSTCPDFGPAIRMDGDTPCDLTVGKTAIDTKYRIGSGDSGTLKKIKAYAPRLRAAGYEPLLSFVRNDNLPAAITACRTGGWQVLTGKDTYDYLNRLTGFDIRSFLAERAKAYQIVR